MVKLRYVEETPSVLPVQSSIISDMTPALDLAPILSASLKELKCTGILCAISHGQNPISTHSVGRITEQDHAKQFYIYSITKTFTATAILLLFSEKGLSLDSRFATFLPETPIPASVTVRQLLNHTSGLSDYFSSREYQKAVCENPEEAWAQGQLMQVGLAGTPLFPPGAGWSYSNPGYALLNLLIEQISGMDYFTYCQKAILDRLQLTDTRPFLEPDLAGQLLEGEEPTITGDFRSRYSPKWIAPGCLISTVTDIVRFYHALFSGGLLSSHLLREMTETVDVPHPLPEPLKAAYGLGVMHIRNDPLGDAYGHGGGGPGYTTYAVCYPSLNGAPFTLCFVVNRSLAQTPLCLAASITNAFMNSQEQQVNPL